MPKKYLLEINLYISYILYTELKNKHLEYHQYRMRCYKNVGKRSRYGG
jgi:hypothetical protein